MLSEVYVTITMHSYQAIVMYYTVWGDVTICFSSCLSIFVQHKNFDRTHILMETRGQKYTKKIDFFCAFCTKLASLQFHLICIPFLFS